MASRPPVALDVGPDGIAEIRFAAPAKGPPTLTVEAMGAFRRILSELARRGDVRGVLLVSEAPGAFLAGADLKEMAEILSGPDPGSRVRTLAAEGQGVLLELERLAPPTVAVIAGACLGGGLEVALACRHRVAASGPLTRLGLPEVKLGILPGLGGTQRLPRVVGLSRALGVILAGRDNLSAEEALRIGLVDALVPVEDPVAGARAFLARLRPGPPRRARPPLLLRLLEATPPGRAWIFRRAAAAVAREARGLYPAPPKALAAVRAGFATPGPRGYEEEARLVGECAATPVAHHLVSLFLRSRSSGNEALERMEGPPPEAREAAVLGAGLMGSGIAHLLASRGIPVAMRDVSPALVAKGMAAAARIVREDARRRRLPRRDGEALLRRIRPRTDLLGLGRADVVIEAIVEEVEAKRKALAEAEGAAPARGRPPLLATNTSTIPIREIAAALRRPGRFLGLHFFHPVRRMLLVEVIPGPATEPEAVAEAVALARRLGKVPVIVADRPGFLVNRLLGPYMAEAGLLLEEGADPGELDAALRDFGMPMGPLELLHEVGVGTAKKAAAVLLGAYGERWEASKLLAELDPTVPLMKGERGRRRPDRATLEALRARVAAGKPPRRDLPRLEMRERCVLALVNEAAHALADGIVASGSDLDLAMVLGTGFAPWTGGPCAFADARGLGAVVRDLETLAARHGRRFRPAPLLGDLAAKGGSLAGFAPGRPSR
ncbi:MAG: 3-hydroxyacyl-CoA dehydrogenase NAD-binding domain-containing protein [Planctomycetales bacterium]|nr:3-hydroxyacyl-CoA dehydrogenase NAD-binding domain-containing protein [Planctomycetales bacterium]